MMRWLRHGGLGALGVVLLTAALAGYRSYEDRAVFGRWSWAFAGLIGFHLVLTAMLAARAVMRSMRPTDGRDSSDRDAAPFPWAGLGLLFWGGAQFLSSRLDPNAIARLIGGGVCASVHPLPSLLEWVAIVLLLIGATQAFGPGLWAQARASHGGRAVLVNVGLALASVSLVLLAGEGLARLRVAIHPTVQGFPSLSTMAWKLRSARLNGYGYRDRDHPRRAPTGQSRLVVVGDSVAWGWGLENTDDRFGEQLARILSRIDTRPWEPITAARSDTHTLDHVRYLERALMHRPDVVVLLYVFNDIDYLAPVTPRRTLPRPHPYRLLLASSCLAQELAVRVGLLGRSAPGTVDPYLDVKLVRRHLEDVRRFVEVAMKSGARPLVVPFDIRASQPGEARARYDLFVLEAAGAGLPVVPIAAAFAGHSFDELTVNRLDRHPNERAHGLAAAAVAAWLRDGTR